MIEHFKPAGHKAPNITTAIALEETFKPIQRVTHKNKTIGYLLRDVEYRNGHAGDLVLAQDELLDKNRDSIHHNLPNSRSYLSNEENNPYSFRVPSGPLMIEISYRAIQDTSKLHLRVVNQLRKTYFHWPVIDTTIDYNKSEVHHTHLDGIPETQPLIMSDRVRTIVSKDVDVTTQSLLGALFGRRASQAHTILSKYAAPAILRNPPTKDHAETCQVLLGISYSGFIIGTYRTVDAGPVRGVALAEKILNIPGVEVHDD